jgi:hypothetical protein
MAGECADGSWEGWLEFVLMGHDRSAVYATPIAARHHDRATMAQWAAGLTDSDAAEALARATLRQPRTSASRLPLTRQELVETLDRRIPQVERREAETRADADRFRACAMQRMALRRRRATYPDS